MHCIIRLAFGLYTRIDRALLWLKETTFSNTSIELNTTKYRRNKEFYII